MTPAPRRRTPYLLIAILLLVNAAGIWGQTGWGLEHIAPAEWAFGYRLALALGFAAALELIGVFLARMADEAEAVDLPAGGYRLGSYAVGMAVGALNFSHFLGQSFAMAVSFGLLSSASPFLWGIYSTVRRGHPAAPSRRLWHPWLSWQLIRYMAWEGIASEDVAISQMRGQADTPAPATPAQDVATGGHAGQDDGDTPASYQEEDMAKAVEECLAVLASGGQPVWAAVAKANTVPRNTLKRRVGKATPAPVATLTTVPFAIPVATPAQVNGHTPREDN